LAVADADGWDVEFYADEELSEQSGVRQADISRIERGAGNPTEATLQRLASALEKRLELV
jgi:transcriptional regulator with XRE-family HTH domain